MIFAVIAFNIVFGYAVVQQVILKHPFGRTPAPDWVLVLVELFFLLLLIFMFSIKLTTIVDEGGIRYRYFPLQRKTTLIKWEDVHTAVMRQYNSFYEYGGWGIMKGTAKNGDAINTSASSGIGLQLELMNRRRLLIGTAKPEELEKAVALYCK